LSLWIYFFLSLLSLPPLLLPFLPLLGYQLLLFFVTLSMVVDVDVWVAYLEFVSNEYDLGFDLDESERLFDSVDSARDIFDRALNQLGRNVLALGPVGRAYIEFELKLVLKVLKLVHIDINQSYED
jgi:hypothetical protein